MKHFFLISTDHLEDRLWFRDEEDFRVAMNYVAVAAFLYCMPLIFNGSMVLANSSGATTSIIVKCGMTTNLLNGQLLTY